MAKLILSEKTKKRIQNVSMCTVDTAVPPNTFQAVTRYNNVLAEEKLNAIETLIASLVGRYYGESYWCPNSEKNPNWGAFFAAFYAAIFGHQSKKDIAGVEWWVRRKPNNIGHDFHFDKDEHLFNQTKQVVTPQVSSVFYINEGSGRTLVLNHTPQNNRSASFEQPSEMAVGVAQRNSLLVFPGDLCHGVSVGDNDALRITLLMNWWEHKPHNLKTDANVIQWPSVQISNPAATAVPALNGELFKANSASLSLLETC